MEHGIDKFLHGYYVYVAHINIFIYMYEYIHTFSGKNHNMYQ